MTHMMQSFSIEELEELDPDQIELLRRAIEREIGNSPEIKKIVRANLQPMYDRLVAKKGAAPAKKAARKTRSSSRK